MAVKMSDTHPGMTENEAALLVTAGRCMGIARRIAEDNLEDNPDCQIHNSDLAEVAATIHVLQMIALSGVGCRTACEQVRPFGVGALSAPDLTSAPATL